MYSLIHSWSLWIILLKLVGFDWILLCKIMIPLGFLLWLLDYLIIHQIVFWCRILPLLGLSVRIQRYSDLDTTSDNQITSDYDPKRLNVHMGIDGQIIEYMGWY